MEKQILEILNTYIVAIPVGIGNKVAGINPASKEITLNIKSLILYLFNPKCPFIVHWNGVEPGRDNISWDKDNENFTLDEVFEYWLKEVKK